jgi:hypothetical protein
MATEKHKPTILFHDVVTGVIEEREMTDEEIAGLPEAPEPA